MKIDQSPKMGRMPSPPWQWPVILVVLVLGVLFATYWMIQSRQGDFHFRTTTTLTLQQLRERIASLEEKIAGLESAKGEAQPQFREMDEVPQGVPAAREEVLELAQQVAAQTLASAEVVVGGLSNGFALILSVLSVFVAFSLQMYKSDADAKAREIKERFDELEEEGSDLLRTTQDKAKEIGGELAKAKDDAVSEVREAQGHLKASMKAQQEANAELAGRQSELAELDRRTRDFVGRIADVHASAFSELLAVLPRNQEFAETVSRLQNKGLELQARMELVHPDSQRLWDAISKLAAVGTKIAIPDLVRLRDSDSTDKGMALHADEAIRQIRQRSK